MAQPNERFVRVIGFLPLAALGWLVWFIGHPLFKRTPLTHDHPTHLFKAWHFYEKMLPNLQLRGFSHYWVFGYPAGELVPFGEEVWVALFRILTFHQLDWLMTYSLSLFGLLILIAFSAYAFASHFFGRTAGLISGALVLLDPGGWAQAGWAWFMLFGVWPNSLGVCLMLLSIVAIDKLAERFSARRFMLASLLVASSLMAHQIALIFLPIFLTLLVFDRWVRERSRGRSIKNVTLAAALGVGLSAFYVVPMVARSKLTIDLGVAGVPFADVGVRLTEGRYFDGMWPLLVPLGFVGAYVALRRRIPGAVFLTLGTGIFTLGSTDIPFSVFHLETVLPVLSKIEAHRVLLGAKILWFPLVAFALSLPLEALLRVLGRILASPQAGIRSINLRWAFSWALGIALLAPYIPAATNWLYQKQIQKTVPAENVAFYEDLKQVWKTTKHLRETQQGLYRIAYDLPMHDHIATLAPVFDDTWIYKVGYTPTQTFREFPMYFDLTLFRKLMVKYVVSPRSLPRSQYNRIATFGTLRLYELSGYEGKPFEFIGAGDGKLIEFSPGKIRIKLVGTKPDSRLVLFVSHLDRWRATIDGRELPIIQSTIHKAEDPFLMEVPASDGILEFNYVYGAADKVGLLWTISSALLLVTWLFFRWGRAKNLATLKPVLTVRSKLAHFAASTRAKIHLSLPLRIALLAVSLCIFGVWLAARVSSRTALIAKDSIFRDASPWSLTVDGQSCKSDAPLTFQCGAQTVRAQRVSALYGTHLCLSSSTAKELIFRTRQKMGAALRGQYDTQQGTGQITVKVDQDVIARIATRGRDQGQQLLRFDTRHYTGQYHELTIEMRGAPIYCFDFSNEH